MIVADGSYPMLSLMWTTLVFCSWILWFWLLIMMYADIFKRRDIGAGAEETGWSPWPSCCRSSACSST